MNPVYVSVKTGNVLVRKPGMFFWRGRWFHGLVDVDVKDLYDDPADDFSAHVGLTSSMSKGLIKLQDENY